MSQVDLYKSVKTSMLKWIGEINSMKLFDFDSTADEESLEQTDLMGPIEFYMEADASTGTVGVKVAACTHSDPQIQRLNDAINDVFNACQGKAVVVPILHHSSGVPLGHMVSSGNVLAGPVVRLQSRTRPFQTVALVFKLTLTF